MNRHDFRRAFKYFARTGYAARGVVFLVIGVFAAFYAVGNGEMLDSRDALQKLLGGSGFGTFVAILLIVGLVAYSLWRFIQSVLDADEHGYGAKGLAIRAGLFASCFTYGALALYTWSLWRGGSTDDGGGGIAQSMSDFIGSTAASAILALIFLVVAIAHFVKAYKRGYRKYMQPGRASQGLLDPISRTGLSARGIVFLVIAYLFGWRAIGDSGDSGDVGLSDALQYIADLPAGRWLLAAVGVGLVCFAAYSFAEALWRRIGIENASTPG